MKYKLKINGEITGDLTEGGTEVNLHYADGFAYALSGQEIKIGDWYWDAYTEPYHAAKCLKIEDGWLFPTEESDKQWDEGETFLDCCKRIEATNNRKLIADGVMELKGTIPQLSDEEECLLRKDEIDAAHDKLNIDTLSGDFERADGNVPTKEEKIIGKEIFFGGAFYEVAEIKQFPHGKMIGIFDEPPSKHIDYISIDSAKEVYPCNNCQGGGCYVCGGFGRMVGNNITTTQDDALVEELSAIGRKWSAIDKGTIPTQEENKRIENHLNNIKTLTKKYANQAATGRKQKH